MATQMDKDKVKVRNAILGIVFGKDEEITSQVKGTLGTGVPTDFLFNLDDEGGWLSFEQKRTQVGPDGKESENAARITIYMSPAVVSKFMEAMETERFSRARDKSAPKAEAPAAAPAPAPAPAPAAKDDWNPFV